MLNLTSVLGGKLASRLESRHGSLHWSWRVVEVPPQVGRKLTQWPGALWAHHGHPRLRHLHGWHEWYFAGWHPGVHGALEGPWAGCSGQVVCHGWGVGIRWWGLAWRQGSHARWWHEGRLAVPLLLSGSSVHVISTNWAIRGHLWWRSLSVGVGIAKVCPGWPHVRAISSVVRSGSPTHHTVLALPRRGHAVAGVGVGELSLDGSVFRTWVPTTIVVIHVRLLVGVLHGIHVTLVSLGWGAIHTIHGPFVALLKQRCGYLVMTFFQLLYDYESLEYWLINYSWTCCWWLPKLIKFGFTLFYYS